MGAKWIQNSPSKHRYGTVTTTIIRVTAIINTEDDDETFVNSTYSSSSGAHPFVQLTHTNTRRTRTMQCDMERMQPSSEAVATLPRGQRIGTNNCLNAIRSCTMRCRWHIHSRTSRTHAIFCTNEKSMTMTTMTTTNRSRSPRFCRSFPCYAH